MWLPREARGGSDDGGGSVMKTPGRLVQPDVLDWLVCHDMKQKKQKADALRCGWDPVLRPCVVGTATTEHGKSPANSLVCLACLSHPFNENGMQCTPHTPFPSLYWNTLCPTVCAPPPSIQLQSGKQQQQGGRRWMRMNEWMRPFHPHPLSACKPPSNSSSPLFPSFHLWHTAFLHALLYSRPPLIPGFAALCYDCGQCVLHTYLLAPILCRDAHIKDCHFQRSGVSHPHKCCPDTWSGKIKQPACPSVSRVCGG